SQRESSQFLDPVFLEREPAMREISDNRIAAVLIIPTNFTRGYMGGDRDVRLELIKNPAQSMHPVVLEEMLRALVTGLNAIARNFQSEFPVMQKILDGGQDYRQVAALLERAGGKLEAM